MYVESKNVDQVVSKNPSQGTVETLSSVTDKAEVDDVVNEITLQGIAETHGSVSDKAKVDEVINNNTSQDNLEIHCNVSDKEAELVSFASPYNDDGMQMEQLQQQNISQSYEETMSVKEISDSKQQGMQHSYLQPPVLEQHFKQDVWEHTHQHLKQQQYQGTAVQFRQQEVHTEYQQPMMPMEQQSYSDYQPPFWS